MRDWSGTKLQRTKVRPSSAPLDSDPPPGDYGEAYWFWCPGCDYHHRYVTMNAKGDAGPTWSFNENTDAPTFSPSLLCNGSARKEDLRPHTSAHRCHLFLTDGMLRFLSDCTHPLKGQTVPMAPLP